VLLYNWIMSPRLAGKEAGIGSFNGWLRRGRRSRRKEKRRMMGGH